MPAMEAKKCKVPVVTYEKGEITDIVKKHTLQFKDEQNLTRMLEERAWKSVDVEEAYRDVEKCGGHYAARKTIDVYRNVLNKNRRRRL